VPPGDAAAGRQAFVAFKCYACHAVKGEQFPLKPGEVASAGPELSGMGSHHPPEYLAESIMNPSAVLIEGPGYIGGDGRSIMPAYPDMTVGQLANLVAYLRSLTEPDAHAHESPREQTVGGYRVRLVYKQPQAADHHHMHHGSAPAAPVKPRLLVFLTDSATGQPIPYVPMSARIEAPRTAAQTVKLAPAWGPDGFHYGANLRLPEATNRITLSIGVATMQLGTGAPEGLKRPRSVAFGWK
jgi:mono/diheme cytochrome c family protein